MVGLSAFWAQPETSAGKITGTSFAEWKRAIEDAALGEEPNFGSAAHYARMRAITKPTGGMRPKDEVPEPTPHRQGRGPTNLQRQKANDKRMSASAVVLRALPSLHRAMIEHAEARQRGVHRELPNDIFRACQIIGVPEAALQVAASTRA